MPDVKPKEKEADYVSRCVGDAGMVKEFPDQKQRIAVCYSKYKQAKKHKQTQGSTEEPDWTEDSGEGYLLI